MHAYTYSAVIGFVLMLSAILKAINILAFSLEIRQYVDTYICAYPGQFSTVFAIGICILELFTAMLLQQKAYRYIATWFSFLMFLAFTYLTWLNFAYPSELGSIESCGCFGELIHITPKASFIKCVLLSLISGFAIYRQVSDKKERCRFRMHFSIFLTWCLLSSIAIPMYSILLMRRVGESVYLMGYCFLCVIILTNFLYPHRKKLRNYSLIKKHEK